MQVCDTALTGREINAGLLRAAEAPLVNASTWALIFSGD